jgi:hypothetical protein
MISINTLAETRELLDLAREIQEHQPLMTMREAIHHACAELPAIVEEVQADATFVPARLVWFDADGQPCRVPNLLTPQELVAFTGGYRDH